MNALVSGLFKESISILSEALDRVYGEGVIEIIELSESSLRQRIRLATKGNGSVETVLIVLDSDSYVKCKDMEELLEQSGKFHLYTSIDELVEYINKRFNLVLSIGGHKVNKDSIELPNAVDIEIEEYRLEISYLNKRLESLSYQVKDLENALEEGGYNLVQDSNESEKSEHLLNEVKVEYEGKISVLEKEREALKNSVEKLEEIKNSLISDLESVKHELQDYQIKYSTQTGLISSKDRELSVLKSKIEDLSKSLVEKELSQTEASSLKSSMECIQKDIALYKAENDKKSKEINELSELLSKSKEEKENIIHSSKQEIQILQEKCDSLEEIVQEYKRKNLEEQVRALSGEREELKGKISLIEGNSRELESTIVELNKQKLEMQNRVNILEKSTSRNSDIESIMSELSTLRYKYDELSSNLFSKLRTMCNHNSKLELNLLKSCDRKYNNIKFVFAGSAESRKGMYKCLYSKCTEVSSKEKILIVDAVSETSIDYVFEINSLKSSVSWFNNGGSFNDYLSKTKLNNVSVLSAGGTAYINDVFFLSVDWHSRLEELESSGYKVLFVCGDISNTVGRIMHNSFSNVGGISIYVHGNAVCSRSVITNIRGLPNVKSSIVYYFDFNKQVQRYADIVGKICEYKILNNVR